MKLFEVTIQDDKLFIFGDAVNFDELYLPDCTKADVYAFLHHHIQKVSHEVAKDRPWRKEGEQG